MIEGKGASGGGERTCAPFPRLRDGERKDAAALLRIYDDANRLFPRSCRADGTMGAFEKLLDRDRVVVMELEAGPVGWMSYRAIDAAIEMSGLYVIRRYQRSGYGTLLMEELLSVAERAKAGCIFLKALANAGWARAFYEKSGFRAFDPGCEDLPPAARALCGARLDGHSILYCRAVHVSKV